MRCIVQPGQVWKHFKGNQYRILNIGEHTETGELMVVYALVESIIPQTWVRPLSMFVEELDKEQYPDAQQKHRFERIQ